MPPKTTRKCGGRPRIIGTREEVWEGKMKKTSGGLTKKDLKETKDGRIVSKAVSRQSREKFDENFIMQDHAYNIVRSKGLNLSKRTKEEDYEDEEEDYYTPPPPKMPRGRGMRW